LDDILETLIILIKFITKYVAKQGSMKNPAPSFLEILNKNKHSYTRILSGSISIKKILIPP